MSQEIIGLLQWSAYYNASECTEVICFSETIALDYGYKMFRMCLLNLFIRILKVLLEYGASVDKNFYYGTTPLHMAAEYGHTEVAKVNL